MFKIKNLTSSRNDNFVYYIKGLDDYTKHIFLKISVEGGKSKYIKNLPIGRYEISQDLRWSFGYSTFDDTKIIDIDESNKEVSFENSSNSLTWFVGTNIHLF